MPVEAELAQTTPRSEMCNSSGNRDDPRSDEFLKIRRKNRYHTHNDTLQSWRRETVNLTFVNKTRRPLGLLTVVKHVILIYNLLKYSCFLSMYFVINTYLLLQETYSQYLNSLLSVLSSSSSKCMSIHYTVYLSVVSSWYECILIPTSSQSIDLPGFYLSLDTITGSGLCTLYFEGWRREGE